MNTFSVLFDTLENLSTHKRTISPHVRCLENADPSVFVHLAKKNVFQP